MTYTHLPISPYLVDLPCRDLRRMVKVVKLLQRLSGNRLYRSFLEKQLPVSARFNPGHHSVMMGYDFHLCPSGPKLIEVNTNAGGLWYACLSYHPRARGFSGRFSCKLLKTFIDDYALFRRDPGARPQCLVIVDETPQQQPLYSEMQVFERMFRRAGIDALIAAPEAIQAEDNGLFIDGKRIDMIYNRHCDFYLKTDTMKNIREAWLHGQVCLSPHPHTYGLLADKRRMILWSQPELMRSFGLTGQDLALLSEMVPATRLLNSLSAEEAWRTRKQWVFKPDTGYASRGVYVGEKLTRHKFAEFDPEDIVLQQRILPSITRGKENEYFKTDYRLFTYRDHVLEVAARIYQGQVTNLRTENGGFAKVGLVD
ncbi:MAG: hypothetical protein ACXWTP_13920 [Methylosarcina sp.]